MRIVAFSQTDFTEDLKNIPVPVLVMHARTIRSSLRGADTVGKVLRNGTLKTYKGFPHGMPTTEGRNH
jgi:non-heme chloroperoxidase